MKSSIKYILSILVPILVVTSIVYAAGSLTPTASVGTATGYTLSDIYNKILNITFIPSAHTVSTTTSPDLSFKSLSDIYNKLDEASTTLVAAKIASTTTIFGITGTLYGDTNPAKVLTTAQYPGTASAGVSYPTTWSADMSGESTHTWQEAMDYCAGTVDGTTGWHLPTVIELMNLYLTTYSPGNPSGFLEGYYWSSTEFPRQMADFAYQINMYEGGVSNYSKTEAVNVVRCAK